MRGSFVAGLALLLSGAFGLTAHAADVSITESVSSPRFVGVPLTYTLGVNAVGGASGVTVTFLYPPGMTGFQASVSPQGSCSDSCGIVTCSLGNVASTGVVTVVLTPEAASIFTTVAGVISDDYDTSMGNNSASLATTVTPPTPVVTSVSPNSGYTTATQVVTITGLYFRTGATVTFGTTPATSVIVDSTTQIRATTPTAAQAGAVAVSVINPGNLVGTLANGYTYNNPPAFSVQSVTPSSGSVNGGTPVQITGSGFQSNATVKFGGTPAQSATFVNATRIDAVTATHAPGLVDVQVTQGASTATGLNAFTYVAPPPTISSVAPATGLPNVVTDVVITGTSFQTGAKVFFRGVQAELTAPVTPTQISAKAPALPAGFASVAVQNPDLQGATLINGFNYVTPQAFSVSSVTPNSGSTDGGFYVAITGIGFGTTPSDVGVAFGNTGAQVISVSDTQIVAKVPAHAVGVVDVVISNRTGLTTSLGGAFTYIIPQPVINYLEPNSGPAAGGTSVTIRGVGFQGLARVFLGGVEAQASTIEWDRITLVTPANAVGPVTVTVTNPNTLSGSLTNGFTYTAGTSISINSLSTTSGCPAGGDWVVITGTGFLPDATVSFGPTPSAQVTFENATTIVAKAPPNASGTYNVTVTSGGLNAVKLNAYTYLPTCFITINSIAPATGNTSGGMRVHIVGTNFGSNTTVKIGSKLLLHLDVVSATSLYGDTDYDAAGAKDVAVKNGGGQCKPATNCATLASAFTFVPIPQISSVTANSGPVSGGQVVTITGVSFRNNSLQIKFGGTPAPWVLYRSATMLTAAVPPHAAGLVNVELNQTINGQAEWTQMAEAYTYIAPPTVSSVSPNQGLGGGGTAVSITGTNFAAGATVSFGGVPAANVVITDSSHITCNTPAHASGAVDVVVRNGDGQEGTLASGFTYGAQPPKPTSVSPASGWAAGGTSITITGTGFVTGATVSIGGTSATGVSVQSSTQITATAPAHAAGSVNVVVSNTDGQTGTLLGGFTYYGPPTVLAIAPSSGPAAGGTTVSISGTGFRAGVSVTMGGVPATGVSVQSATEISATSPAHAAGPVNVVVTNNDSQNATLANAFTYLGAAPTVTSVTPPSGPAIGGTTVTISGTNFRSGAVVLVGGVPATAVVVGGATTITATAPPNAAGPANVTVTNDDGQSGTLAGGFLYQAAPLIADVSPGSGPSAGGTAIIISGTGFRTGASVTIGGTPANAVTIVGPTQITATSPAHAVGSVSVVVTNVDGQTHTLASGFRYLGPAPTISSIAPNAGPLAGGTIMTIAGTNFSGSTVVSVGGVAATGLTFVSSTQITAVTPGHGAGSYDVQVTNTNDGQYVIKTYGFTYYPAPTIGSIAPALGPIAGGTSVTITGTGFRTGATVTIGGTAATSVNVVGDTQITAVAAAHAAGYVNVVVTNNDGQAATLTNGYRYLGPPPTLSAINPTSGPTAGGTSVVITGTNFVSGATVTFDGVAATSVVVTSATQISAMTPVHAAAGVVPVVVTNADGQATAPASVFTYYAPPTVSSIAPASGPIDGVTPVTITGTAFRSGATVKFGGTSATSVVVVSATQITCNTPAHAAGQVDVVVTNTDGQLGTLPNGFSYQPPPSVTSISPANGPTSGGTNVTISGSSFVSGATVSIGGVAATGVSVVSGVQITATTPAHSAGAVAVVVTNPDTQPGTLDNGYTYVFGPPTLTSVSPSSGAATGGTALTITGTGFLSGDTVWLGGVQATGVTIVNPGQITATAPAHAPATVSVQVMHAGGLTSTLTNAFTYTGSGATFVRIESGSDSSYTDTYSRIWAADTGFTASSTASTGNQISGTDVEQIYRTYRYSPDGFSYNLSVPNGPQIVKLRFAETVYGGAGERLFQVKAGGQEVLGSFDVADQAGGSNRALDRQFPVTITGGQLSLDFIGYIGCFPNGCGEPMVNAIEIGNPLPDGVLRVNAGGTRYMDPLEREYVADQGYSGGTAGSISLPVSETDMPDLYQTYRTSGSSFQYQFTVPSGSHTVRLRFMEPTYTSGGNRVFNVVINGTTVLTNFDVYLASWNRMAHDRVFNINVTDGQVTIQFVPVTGSPIVSAIEIQ